ncbi:MAG: RNA methyltransferase [Bacillota bacterium]
MEPIHVTSSNHPLLKEYVKLQKNTRYRQKQQQIALEGPNLVSEAIRAGLTPRAFFYTQEYYEQAGKEWADNFSLSAKQVILPERLFKKIAETETPQPVAAIFYFSQAVYELKAEKKRQIYLILDRVQDPGNMGTIIRTAAGAGVGVIFYTTGSTDPYSPKVLRATAGSIFRIQLKQTGDPLNLIRYLKQEGVQVIAASVGSEIEHWSAEYNDRCALIIGNEAVGIDEKLVFEADLTITVPLYGPVESLNAAVAAAIILFEIARCSNK